MKSPLFLDKFNTQMKQSVIGHWAIPAASPSALIWTKFVVLEIQTTA